MVPSASALSTNALRLAASVSARANDRSNAAFGFAGSALIHRRHSSANAVSAAAAAAVVVAADGFFAVFGFGLMTGFSAAGAGAGAAASTSARLLGADCFRARPPFIATSRPPLIAFARTARFAGDVPGDRGVPGITFTPMRKNMMARRSATTPATTTPHASCTKKSRKLRGSSSRASSSRAPKTSASAVTFGGIDFIAHARMSSGSFIADEAPAATACDETRASAVTFGRIEFIAHARTSSGSFIADEAGAATACDARRAGAFESASDSCRVGVLFFSFESVTSRNFCFPSSEKTDATRRVAAALTARAPRTAHATHVMSSTELRAPFATVQGSDVAPVVGKNATTHHHHLPEKENATSTAAGVGGDKGISEITRLAKEGTSDIFAAATPTAKATADASRAIPPPTQEERTAEGLSNADAARVASAAIRDRATRGQAGNIFAAASPVAVPVPAAVAARAVIEDVVEIPLAKKVKRMTAPELRIALRERGLNPGGGKDALEERLAEAIEAGACAPLGAPPAPEPEPEPQAVFIALDEDDDAEAEASRGGSSKRPSPGPADGDDADARKIARMQNAGHDVFAAGTPIKLKDPSWVPKADAFLVDLLNSPSKTKHGATVDMAHRAVSDAKLRDLGAGRDVFADGSGSALKPRRHRSERMSQQSRGTAGGIFGDDAAAEEVVVSSNEEEEVEMSDVRKRALEMARGHGGLAAVAEDAAPISTRVDAAAEAKRRECAGSDIFADASAEKKKKPRGKALCGVGEHAATKACEDLFATSEEDAAAKEERSFVQRGGKVVSEQLKASLRGNVFDATEEAAAFAAIAAKADPKKATTEARATSRAMHVGHGIFSDAWVNAPPAADGEDGETTHGLVPAIEKKTAEEEEEEEGTPARGTMKLKPANAFRGIGEVTPGAEFKWKTPAEEEREELVREIVERAIAKAIEGDAATA